MFSLNTGDWYSPQVFQMSKVWPGRDRSRGESLAWQVRSSWGDGLRQEGPSPPTSLIFSPHGWPGQQPAWLEVELLQCAVQWETFLFMTQCFSTPVDGHIKPPVIKASSKVKTPTAKSWSISKRGKTYILGKGAERACFLFGGMLTI